MKTPHLAAVPLLAFAAALTAAPLEGQMTLVRGEEVEAAQPAASAALVELRSVEELAADLAGLRDAAADLTIEIQRYETERAGAEAQVEIKKHDIDLLKDEIDRAKDADEDARVDELERRKDQEERQKKLLERYEDLWKKQIELAEVRQDVAKSTIRVREWESRLHAATTEFESIQGTEGASLDRALRLRGEVHSLEVETLEAMKDLAGDQEDEAKRYRKVIEARLDVAKARREVRVAG